MVKTRLPLHLVLDRPRSETDGTDEFYFTEALGDGLEGELRSVCAKVPNATTNDIGELGIYRMRQFWPICYRANLNTQKGMDKNGRYPIYGGERVYVKVTGTAVDVDVELNGLGYAFPALPEGPGEPASP